MIFSCHGICAVKCVEEATVGLQEILVGPQVARGPLLLVKVWHADLTCGPKLVDFFCKKL